MPGMPSTPSAVDTGACFGSSLRSATPGATAWDCQPAEPCTTSPFARPGYFDSSTSPTVAPTITCPSSTDCAYDLVPLMRPRMYGSSER